MLDIFNLNTIEPEAIIMILAYISIMRIEDPRDKE